MAQRSGDSTPAQPESAAKAEVIDKLVRAARGLFAARGPAAVPLREIAAEAGVNYGLIHHYVGTKDDLLRLVFLHASQEYAEEFSSATTARDAAEFMMRSRNPEFVRMLARSLLDDSDNAAVVGRSPAMTELSRRIGEELPTDPEMSDPRVIAAMLTTISMGWTLFGGFVREITGLSDVPDQQVKDMIYTLALAGVDLD